MGKNYSGGGMDPHIIGRSGNPNLKIGIDAQRLCVLDLTDVSHGNATGMGRADITTRRLFDKIDFDTTYPNAITDHTPDGYKIPIIADNDKEAIQAALATCMDIDADYPRMIFINNTLEIERILVSEAMVGEAKQVPQLTVEGEPFELTFDDCGALTTRF